MSITELSPHQLQQLLHKQPETVLLDVREHRELAICQIPNSVHIPLNLLPIYHNQLPDDVPIVLVCHHGIRSLNAARFLAQAGFDTLYNLSGGIDAWAQQIAPDMARY